MKWNLENKKKLISYISEEFPSAFHKFTDREIYCECKKDLDGVPTATWGINILKEWVNWDNQGLATLSIFYNALVDAGIMKLIKNKGKKK